MQRTKGSLTVFATLTLMLVASFLFSFLEYARSDGIRTYIKMDPPASTASLLSKYNRECFTRYGIFLLDGAFRGESLNIAELNGMLQEYSQNNLKPVHGKKMFVFDTVNFFQCDTKDVSIEEILLATDYEGEPFRRLCADSMTYEYPIDLAQRIYNEIEENATSAENAKNDADSATSSAYGAINDRKAAYVEEYSVDDEFPVEPPEVESNPMDDMEEVKTMDMLTLLVPAEKNISSKTMGLEQSLTNRDINEGNMEFSTDGDWYERFLFDEFLYQHFTNYQTSTNESDKALDYELEYIVSGKGSDRENLQQVAVDILGMREGMNFLYLLSCTEKRQTAQALATAILSAYPVAEVANIAVMLGILAAWAFAESVLDVRTLLAGGKISWFKSDDDWTLGIENISSIASNGMRAKDAGAKGQDYNNYIETLLYTKLNRTLNYRTMDVIENQVHAKSGYENVKMDHMIISLKARFDYGANTVFSDLVSIGGSLGGYSYYRTFEDTYLKVKET